MPRDAEVEAAARAANAHEFIANLKDGYNTKLGERGGGLSQGQRQLIGIARAMLANPRILILDEATSSVDTRTEALIQSALSTLLKGPHQLCDRAPAFDYSRSQPRFWWSRTAASSSAARTTSCSSAMGCTPICIGASSARLNWLLDVSARMQTHQNRKPARAAAKPAACDF